MTDTPSTRPQMGDEFNTPLTRTQFIVQMAIHIARCAGLDAKRALPIAASCYKEFMDEIAVTHGDPRYAWDEAAARTVVAEYELAPSTSLPQPTAGSTEGEELRVILDKLNRAVPLIEGPVGTKLTEPQSEGVMLVDSARTKINTLINRVASTPAQSGLVEALRDKLRELAIADVHRPSYGGGTVHWGYRCNACDADLEQAEVERLQSVPDFHKPDCLLSNLSHAPSQPAPVVAESVNSKLLREATLLLQNVEDGFPMNTVEFPPWLRDCRKRIEAFAASPQPDRESEELINRLREYASDWCIRAGSKQVVDDAIEYLSRGRSSQQEGVNAKLLAAAKFARKQLNHEKTDCWATGPRTGNPINDLIACPGCAAIAKLDQAITSSNRPQATEGE